MKTKWLARIAVVLGVCATTLLVATPVAAVWDWCEVDPTLNIGGHTVTLQAFVQGDPDDIIGQTVFTVVVPAGTRTSIVSLEKAAKVNFVYSGWPSANSIPVRVSADIKTKHRQSYPARLTASIDGQAPVVLDEGTTSRDLSGSFTLSGGSSDSSNHDNGNRDHNCR